MNNILDGSFRLEILFQAYLSVILLIVAATLTVMTAIYFSRLAGKSFRSVLKRHLAVGLISWMCGTALLFGESLVYHEQHRRQVSEAIERDDYTVREIWGIEALVIIYPGGGSSLFPNNGVFLARTVSDELVAHRRETRSVSGNY